MRKDTKWLKEEIKVFQEGEDMFTAEFNAGVQQALEYVQELIDQLDEPETLSEKWIENHTASADTISYYSDENVPVVTVSNLKGLLVPIQDKPVIPQFVADWIEKQMKFGYEDVFISMTRLRERAPEKVKFWFRNNSDTYARAWLDGYEVEKEKLYHVVNEENYFMLRKDDGLVVTVVTMQVSPAMSRDKYGKDTRFMLTEKEIKDYDERYWAFAEEVTPCN